ncbi:MAG: SelB C-terminal domain-containing protein [Chloroflexota bacterium]|nr:SelB C-terminal domain-containing protein [Chloroflexota bacterium]
MTNVVLGTAGHVDHGKSALVRALTGVDPDRLPEEQRRQMTIDLGYAHLPLPGGIGIDFIDVPGHEDYLGNMLVGAAQADGFLLVVDVVEGLRQQTDQHIQALTAFDVRSGVLAVTKMDLMAPDLAALAVSAIADEVANRLGAAIPVVAVSTVGGQGVSELKQRLADLVHAILNGADVPPSRVSGAPVVLIDRAFALVGRGTIVTGTQRGGRLVQGARIRIEPAGVECVVAELHRHGRSVPMTEGSVRIGARIRGVGRLALRRGMLMGVRHSVWSAPAALVTLPTAPVKFDRIGQLMVHAGTSRSAATMGRMRAAGSNRFARISLREDMPFVPGTPILLRRGQDLWSCRLVDAGDGKNWATLSSGDLRRAGDCLSRNDFASAALIARGAMMAQHWSAVAEICDRAPSPPAVAIAAGSVVFSANAWRRLLADLLRTLQQSGPVGMSNDELRQRTAQLLRQRWRLAGRFDDVTDAALSRLIRRRRIVTRRTWAFETEMYESTPNLPGVGILLAALSTAGPPSLSSAAAAARCPDELPSALERQGRIIRVGRDLAYEGRTYAELVTLICRIARRGPVTPGALRDTLAVSRRYAIALLEHLDEEGVLRRSTEGHWLI